MRGRWLVYNGDCSKVEDHRLPTMDPPVFTNHYSSIIQGLRYSGLATPWIKKGSLLGRIPFLAYDASIVAILLFTIYNFMYTFTQTKVLIEDVFSLGVGTSLFSCALLETAYHATFRHRIKQLTDNIDYLAESIVNSELGRGAFLKEIYQKDVRTMKILAKVTILSSILCPFSYCFSVPIIDAMNGEYRTKYAVPMDTPFDNKQPVVYEFLNILVPFSHSISCIKKGFNDCFFLALFWIQTAFLQYLSTSMEHLQKDMLIRGKKFQDRKKLIRWIGLHQEVLRSIQELIAVFSPIVIIYYLNIIVLVVSGLFVQIMKNNENLIQSVGMGIYVFLTISHMLLLSNTAYDLTKKAENMGFVAYDIPWFEMAKRDVDMLRMVLTMSNRPIYVTAYRAPIFLLNRETFAGFMATVSSALVTMVQMRDRFG